MPKRFWKSLRSRILLLAVLTFVFLAGAAFSFFAFLRSSHTVTLSTAERHLVAVASGLAGSYAERPASTPSLASISPQPIPSPPPREPEAGDLSPGPPPPRPRPRRPAESDPLTQLTARALRQESGIEGGFFAANSGALLGYAFPTHESPGPNKEMPQRERPTIDKLVQESVATASTKTSRFEGPHDAVLFVALPIRERPASSSPAEVTGAVWLMQRIPGITGGRSRQLLWGSIGFSSAALITALLTFFVTGEVRNGVNGVLDRLSALENGLFTERMPPAPGSHLEEFDRVLRGVDTLAASLQQKIHNERALEAEMRHKERLSALGQFAAGIAHELRNPLATIRLRTQMSQRNPEAEAVTRNSKVVLEEIERLDTIIGRLLYFARPIQLNLESVSLDELCSTTAAAWTDRQTAPGVQISCEGESQATILCDRSRIVQVLDNLMENAIHSAATRSHGTVSIAASRSDALAQIEVRDNGPGLDSEALRHALDPFFTTKDSGTGLGLSISFEIVQAHGGDLHLRNNQAGGAVASIRLPLTALTSVLVRAGESTNGRLHG